MYAKKHIGRAEREILAPVSHRNYFFKSYMYKAFPTAADPADRAVGPLSPLPCHALHGYGVSSAHHGEVRGCRRACERTPLMGRRRCAAGGRQGGTNDHGYGPRLCRTGSRALLSPTPHLGLRPTGCATPIVRRPHAGSQPACRPQGGCRRRVREAHTRQAYRPRR
jgi:hypothetical protein